MDARGILLEKSLLSPKEQNLEIFQNVKSSDPLHKKSVRPMISIIVPAHNEERYLAQTLNALHGQNYGSFEIIVVANGCTDSTPEVAHGRCHRLIILSQKSLGVARNLGARMARGQLLVFLDADTLLEPMALRRIVEDFSETDAAGTITGQPDSNRLSYRVFYFIKNSVHRLLHTGSSGVIICWKRHFIEIGGFDEGLEVRENSELIKRLRHYGKYCYISDITATTSMRRYDQRGFAHMTWLWLKLWWLSTFGDLHRRSYEAVR
jgi:glycosyltransferase involved in cell wall biosynthesis